MALCDADPRLPKHASPRQVAGGSLEENILKCQLKPLEPADYAPVAFTAAQLDAAERRVPRRRVRLEQARRRPAGGDLAAHLRGRSGRRAAPAGTYGAEPAALGLLQSLGRSPATSQAPPPRQSQCGDKKAAFCSGFEVSDRAL